MKQKYLHLVDHLTEGEWYHIQKEVNDKADDTFYKQKLDEFLSIYSRYQESQDPREMEKMIALSKELNSHNPKFIYKPNE